VVCANPQLSALDSRMAQMVCQAVSNAVPSFRRIIQRDQLSWLGKRNGCGANVRCLRAAYTGQIAALLNRDGQGAP